MTHDATRNMRPLSTLATRPEEPRSRADHHARWTSAQPGYRRTASLVALLAASLLSLPAVQGPAAGAVAPTAVATAGGGARTVVRTAAFSSHFRYVAGDAFASNRVDARRWVSYDGRPGCCPDTLWAPARATVSGGVLHLRNQKNAAGRWLSGGVGASNWSGVARTYGRFEARMKFARGTGFSSAGLLWPKVGWPPEMDFYEINPEWGDRRTMMATNHWKTASGAHKLSQSWFRKDFTQWHTVAVEWTPYRLDVILDGVRVKRERNRSRIPHQPMFPAFQTHVHRDAAGRLPSGSTGPTLSVDYLKVWRWQL